MDFFKENVKLWKRDIVYDPERQPVRGEEMKACKFTPGKDWRCWLDFVYKATDYMDK